MAKNQTGNQQSKRSQGQSRTPGEVDNARLSSDMGETDDSLLEANRSPQAQQTSRADEKGQFGERSRNRRPGTFGIDDTPNARPETQTEDREINEDMEAVQKADDEK